MRSGGYFSIPLSAASLWNSANTLEFKFHYWWSFLTRLWLYADHRTGRIFRRRIRDVTESRLKVGAKVKLRLVSVLRTDTQPTPTVELEVRRTTPRDWA